MEGSMATWRVIVAASVLAACRINFDAAPQDAPAPDSEVVGTVRLHVAGHGLLATDDGTTCSTDCEVPATGSTTVTAYAPEAWQLDRFDAPCGALPACTIEPGQTVTATFTPLPITANRVFV